MGNRKTEIKARYDKANSRRYNLKYNIKTDADIISFLDKQPSIQGYIKALIRADIAANGGTQEVEQPCPSSEE